VFGFLKKRRAIYGREVRDFLHDQLRIEIDAERNSAFYGEWALEDLIVKGFYHGVNSTHCALIIGRHYLYELLKKGTAATSEAKQLNTTIDFKASIAASRGLISREVHREYEDELRRIRIEKFR